VERRDAQLTGTPFTLPLRTTGAVEKRDLVIVRSADQELELSIAVDVEQRSGARGHLVLPAHGAVQLEDRRGGHPAFDETCDLELPVAVDVDDPTVDVGRTGSRVARCRQDALRLHLDARNATGA